MNDSVVALKAAMVRTMGSGSRKTFSLWRWDALCYRRKEESDQEGKREQEPWKKTSKSEESSRADTAVWGGWGSEGAEAGKTVISKRERGE